MSFTKIAVATIILSVASLSSSHAQDRSGNWTANWYIPKPLTTPVNGDYVGKYDASVYFSGVVTTPNSTVAIFAQTYSGQWTVVATTKSSNTKSRYGGYFWSVSDSIPLKCWDILSWNSKGFYGAAKVRAVSYPSSYGPDKLLGEVTVYSFSTAL